MSKQQEMDEIIAINKEGGDPVMYLSADGGVFARKDK